MLYLDISITYVCLGLCGLDPLELEFECLVVGAGN